MFLRIIERLRNLLSSLLRSRIKNCFTSSSSMGMISSNSPSPLNEKLMMCRLYEKCFYMSIQTSSCELWCTQSINLTSLGWFVKEREFNSAATSIWQLWLDQLFIVIFFLIFYFHFDWVQVTAHFTFSFFCDLLYLNFTFFLTLFLLLLPFNLTFLHFDFFSLSFILKSK